MKYASLFYIALICSLVSCRKDTPEDPDKVPVAGSCRLASFTDYLNAAPAGTVHMRYDPAGRIQTAAYPSGAYDFAYRGDTVFVIVTGGCGDRTDTIVHQGGRVTLAAYGDQRAHRRIHYAYDAAGQLRMSRCNVYGAIQEDHYIWAGGDLIADSIVVDGVPAETYRFTYDLNRTDQVGNPGTIMQYLTDGLPLYKTRHLLTQINRGSAGIYDYRYEFDEDQKIRRAYIVGSQLPQDTSVFEYTYECF